MDIRATFPGGDKRSGIAGLQRYIHERREADFTRNLCGKLLAYALGRSPMLSDEPLVEAMMSRAAADGYRFANLVESIVTSPQFLNKRGRDDLAER